MTTIKDSVHDYIELHPTAEALLDTEPMQRLRYVRQLSTVQLVYPAANHTRFEHSLGVYHLASRAVDQLDLEDALADRLRAAALVHDVGHGPFGHQTERAIERHLGRHHDEIGWLLAETELGTVLEEQGIDLDAVAATVDGRGPLGELVSGPLDVDRMDYLVRDAHHTGVPYGTIDHARLIRAFRLVDGELVIADDSVASAESALIARTLMNATVYRHHVSRIAGAMLDRASERVLADGVADPDAFARLTDEELLGVLADYEPTAEFASRLRNRRLYKRAAWARREDVPETFVDLSYDRTRALEREIADVAGADPSAVILDSPGTSSSPESRARILVDGEPQRLGDRSPLVAGLDACAREIWRLGVYAPPDVLESVREATVDVLELAGDPAP
ncbi:HD domain-containing protein [Natronococcus occultus]|uniref:HD superfamily phosphohydrolase n=1 Tax=Natronococcus occultus SP4 TaxID=694430 RepID=L0K1S9_9EURY|nr:HD domain-containing protein [Natronococcus occultus]AGB38289.1 HD superfamily phosphohydrolase [Natronococcus occultus SP4]